MSIRIGLNLLHAQPGIGGGWNYISNLISAIAKYDQQNIYVAFVTKQSECLIPRNKPNIQRILIDIPTSSRLIRIFFENTVLLFWLKNHQLDCIHWFSGTKSVFCPIPSVVTIYDLKVFILGKSSFSQKLYLKWMVKHTTRSASRLLPMSISTQDELQSILLVDKAKTTVIPPVLNEHFKCQSPIETLNFRTTHGLPENFWLYVAHFYPHKNHVRLLYAYHELTQKGLYPWKLVLRGDPRGAETEVQTLIKHLALEKSVIMMPRLDESELPFLYSAASGLVFPSLYEGGGIPVIEAMACGCPIAASKIPSVHEYIGDCAEYFDPNDIQSIANAMDFVQKNNLQREERVKKGLERSEKYYPQSIIDSLVNAYRATLTRL